MKLPICDITPFTVQDFPDHTACILWFGGCNMRCVYCHNPELVTGRKERLPWQKIQDFLASRQGKLDGVVLTGGECTLSPLLPKLLEHIRAMGFKVKLDTNGGHPTRLAPLLEQGMLDYVALDYKAPREKFQAITGTDLYHNFRRSLILLCRAGIPFEVRTTVHTALLNADDLRWIMGDLNQAGFNGTYYIQNFRRAPTMICNLPEQSKELEWQKLAPVGTVHIQARGFQDSV
jgi:pyruvate formate lyase activating enzyme